MPTEVLLEHVCVRECHPKRRARIYIWGKKKRLCKLVFVTRSLSKTENILYNAKRALTFNNTYTPKDCVSILTHTLCMLFNAMQEAIFIIIPWIKMIKNKIYHRGSSIKKTI